MSKDLTAALDALTQQRSDTNVVPALVSRGVAPKVKGAAPLDGKPGSGSGAIASPLTESSYAARQWHPEQTLTTTDGIFTIRLAPLKKLFLTDANDAQVVINLAAPT